jgi:hypothetical protein
MAASAAELLERHFMALFLVPMGLFPVPFAGFLFRLPDFCSQKIPLKTSNLV